MWSSALISSAQRRAFSAAVMTITGKRCAEPRSAAATPQPSRTGIRMSRSMRNGVTFSSTLRASRPFIAVTTAYPSLSRIARTVSRIEGSSSTTRIGAGVALRRSADATLPARAPGDSPRCCPLHTITSVHPPIGRLRQHDMERAALAKLALHPDTPAVLLDDALADVQAEPHPRVLPVVDVRRAAETLEDGADILGRDADAVVLHRDARGRSLLPHSHEHRTARRTVFQRIFDEVGEQLRHAVPVEAADDRSRRFDRDPDRVRGPGDLPPRLDEVDRLALADELAVFEAIHVEEPEHQRRQPLRLAHDPRQPGQVHRRGRIALRLALEELRLGDQRRERRLQVVRRRREELLLQEGRLLVRAHARGLVDERAAL